MAKSKRGLWFKFGRFITGLTIAAFLLPFFGVSCQGMDIITISGADMVGGCKPGGMLADAENQAKGVGGGEMKMSSKAEMPVPNSPREPLAIVALLAAIAVFGLSWVRSRGAMIGAVVLSVACLGAMTGLYIKVNGDLKSDVDKQMNEKKHHSGNPDEQLGEEMGKSMMKDIAIDAGARYGFYATCLLLLGGAALCGMALREPEGAELQDAKPAPAA